MMRKALAAAVIVVVLAGVALALVARGTIGGETVRRALEEQLSTRLGEPVSIGSLGASFFPRVAADLRDVSIGQPARATIAELSIATGLRALLSRRVEGGEITITNSRVPMEMLLGMAAAASAAPSGGTGGLSIISIKTLALRNVELVAGSRSLSADLQSSLEGDRLDVARLVATSQGTRLDASGTLTSIAKGQGTFTAGADRLNLDELLVVASGLSGTSDALSPGAGPGGMPALDLVVHLTAPAGQLGGYAFQRLASIVRITPLHLQVQPLRLAVFGGDYDGQLGVALSGRAPAIDLRGRVQGMDVSTLLRETQGSSSMSGRLSGTFSLSTRGSSSDDMVRAARATGQATITDGEIPGLDMVRTIVLGFGKPSSAPAEGTGSRFTRINSTFSLANQTLRSDDIAFASPDFDLTAEGSVQLPAGALDMRANVVLSPQLTAQAGADLRRYAQENGRVVAPATVTGTVEKPRIRLDLASAARRALGNELKRKVKGLLDRFLK